MNRSGFRIDKEGRWFFNHEEITHRKTYLLYSRNLTRDEAGQVILRVGREECPVEVEDTPYIVKTLEIVPSRRGGLESVGLILNDETREPLSPETLRIGAENVPYCEVRGGMFEARFSRGAYQVLTPFIQQEEKENRFFITVGGKKYHLSQESPNGR